MALSKYKLGELIGQRREKYNGTEDLPVRGVSREGFINPKQSEADKSLYNVFYKYDFVFNPARMEINSIALNTEFEKGICSSLYEIFFVTKPEIILHEYLNLFVKRNEFARHCEFIGWGSAREYCRMADISEIEINLPPLAVQKKFVAVYNALLENKKVYERGLDDLKLVCDGYIENLRRNMPCEKIGKYIEISDERNADNFYKAEDVRGISTDKKFIPTKADMEGVSLKNYFLVKPESFAYVPDTSRRGDKISLALNTDEKIFLVSSISVVFSTNAEKLLPQYLMLFFNRSEFDRYARFHSWGSAREVFTWKDLCEVEIPIPDIKIQRSIAAIYEVLRTRKKILERLKAQIKNICPILIKGSLDEGATT